MSSAKTASSVENALFSAAMKDCGRHRSKVWWNKAGRQTGWCAHRRHHLPDQDAAVLIGSSARAQTLGLRPRARIVDSCLVGSDSVLMLTGPIPVTQRLLQRAGLTVDDIDVFEVNEEFASVVLAWQHVLSVDPAKVNPNDGAIALGHPLGANEALLITKALNELERIDGRYALVKMCCGAGMGTGMLVERV